MGTTHDMERRRGERAAADIPLLVWGIDTRGERFVQQARAREISRSGALLSGLEGELRSGDVVGILYAEKKARFRVVWIRQSGTGEKIQAAVQRLDGDVCPWSELLAEEQYPVPSTEYPIAPEMPDPKLGTSR